MVCGVEDGRRTEDSEALIMVTRRPVKGREGIPMPNEGGGLCKRERERHAVELGAPASRRLHGI